MNLLHIVPHVDAEASGPSYSVPRLCESLAAHGHYVELSCLAARGDIPGVKVDVHRQWRYFRRFAVSGSQARALKQKTRQFDIVHNHSLWSMVNVAAGLLVPGSEAKLVTSPRGTLSPWALERRRHIKNVLWPFQSKALVNADMLHATSQFEYEHIRDKGLSAPVAIIPNGIDVPAQKRNNVDASKQRTLLFLARIHPVKGIENLLHAWRELQESHLDWRLVIAGGGEPEHVKNTSFLATSLGCERVEFRGAVYGEDKSKAYFQADLFVLPSHTENFGMVVAEALAHGCPALVSRNAPWAALESEECGWWIENDVRSLHGALNQAMLLSPQELDHMGARGRRWMERDFGWDSIADRMQLAYGWLVRGGDRPVWVRLD